MPPVRRVPTRSCVVCRTVRPKRDLVRVVRRPDGGVVVDETGRVAGRGAYVCREERCLSEGLSKGRLGRALSVPIPAEVRARLTADLATLEPADVNMMNDDEGGARGQE